MGQFFIEVNLEDEPGGPVLLPSQIAADFDRYRATLNDISVLDASCATFSDSAPETLCDESVAVACQPGIGFGRWLPSMVRALSSVSRNNAVAVLEDDGGRVVRAISESGVIRVSMSVYTLPPGFHMLCPGGRDFSAGVFVASQERTPPMGEVERYSVSFPSEDLVDQVVRQAREFCDLVRLAMPGLLENPLNREVYGDVLEAFLALIEVADNNELW